MPASAPKQPHPIQFFMPDEEHGWLCALSDHSLFLDGILWPTAEHYYQAQKFVGHPDIQKQVLLATDPFAAKAIGARHKELRPKDWHPSRSLAAFRRATEAKFVQHRDLKAQLLATGDALLVEANDDDPFWGHGPDGKGENWVGRIAMEVRAKLKSKT